jgi:hypothetical protein
MFRKLRFQMIDDTPLMIACPTLAIDLPLKTLIWEDGERRVWVSYNSPEHLKKRHNIPEGLIQNISGIRSIVEEGARQNALYRFYSGQDALTFAHDSFFPNVPECDFQDLSGIAHAPPHNPKVGGSSPPPATNAIIRLRGIGFFDCGLKWSNKVRTAEAATRRPFAIWCDLEPTRAARRMCWLCASIP